MLRFPELPPAAELSLRPRTGLGRRRPRALCGPLEGHRGGAAFPPYPNAPPPGSGQAPDDPMPLPDGPEWQQLFTAEQEALSERYLEWRDAGVGAVFVDALLRQRIDLSVVHCAR